MRPPNAPWYPFGLRSPRPCPPPLHENMQVSAQGHPHLRPSWAACSSPPATTLLEITTRRDDQDEYQSVSASRRAVVNEMG